jgi:ABC-2 type transport system ATP-binding protein
MKSVPIISLYNLSCRFREKVAVDNLTLEVNAGEVFGFLGHNGAGKTTTVRLLNGLLTPDTGRIRVMGMDPTTQGPALRRHTGVLTETPALEELLTARDNLSIYASLYNVPRNEIATKVQKLLMTFNLADRADDRVRSFSKGMKQRLALARALLHDPEILFFDEPTEGLDPLAAHDVRELISRLSHEEKRTVFLCTHNLAEAQQLCDRVAVLEHGRLLTSGTPMELVRQLADHMPARVDIEVSSPHLSAALDTLRAVPGVTAHAQGSASITLLGAEHEMIPDLVATLVAASIPVYRVSPHEPSLEDVYFALHVSTPSGS